MKIPIFCALISLSLAVLSAADLPNKPPELVVVLVVDGLRPDSVTPEIMPNLDGLKKSGVWYSHAHSVFPTVTRVNAATISTGAVPSHHGIVSNALYLPTVSDKLLNDGDYRNLESLAKLNGGRVVGAKSLGEYFQAAGVGYVAISSGSTGNALLLNPTAPAAGVLINSGFENGSRVAFPDAVSGAILGRYGPVKGDSGDTSLLWTERVLREYVLGTLNPRVIVDWIDQPDEAQHAHGVGSPEALAALRLVDRQIGLLQQRIRQMALDGKTDFIVTCDHGFDSERAGDALAPLREANLAAEDVVVDNEGGASLLYVRNHNPEKIERLAAKLRASETVNAIFVASARPQNGTFRCSPGAEKGFAPGSFALEIANQCLPSHGPDMIVTYRWDAAANAFGSAGTQWNADRPDANRQAAHSGHGGLNPYVTHSTLLLAGRDFPPGKTVELPAGNQDIAPTLLAIEGLPAPADMDGRVLFEALGSGPTTGPAQPSTKRIQASSGSYCAELEISYMGDRGYLDYARRCPEKR